MAMVDHNYIFLLVDVGCQGRLSDGGVFRNSSISKALYQTFSQKEISLAESPRFSIRWEKLPRL